MEINGKVNKISKKEILKLSSAGSALVIVFELSSLAFSYIYDKIKLNFDYTSILYNKNFRYALFYICAYLIAIPLLLLFYHLIRGRKINHSIKTYLKKSEKSFLWCVKWIVIGIGIGQIFGKIVSIVVSIIHNVTGIAQQNESLPEIKCNMFGYVALFTVMCILAPIFEELMFRGTIFINNKPMGEGFAIFTTGLLFALWHINYPQFGNAFVLGMVMSLLTLKTNSLIPSMICHFVNNLICFIMQICSLQFYEKTGDMANMVILARFLYANSRFYFALYMACNIIMTAFAAAGTILLIRELLKLKKRKPLEKGNFEISSAKAKLLYFVSPITLITVVLLTYATFFQPGR